MRKTFPFGEGGPLAVDEVYMKHNKHLTTLSQQLRKNMTQEEKTLWYQYLRNYKPQFRRQVTFGNCILDFYCAAARLAVELDGSQHYEEVAMEADRERDAYLNSLGLTVLRYTNLDVNRKFKEVCEDVYRQIMQVSTSSPAAAGASPLGEAKE